MSLTTLPYPKTHERDDNPYRLSGALNLENTVKAVAAHHRGAAVYPRTGHDAGLIALDGGGWQLSDDPALVSDAFGVGFAAVGGGAGACA